MWINGKYKEKLACVLNATSDDAGKVLAVGSDGNFELVPNTESVATPVANPTGSAVASGSTVELSCETTGASIYYTTNGDTPTSSSTLYESAIEITTGVTIKAIGIKTGSANSSVMSETYTIAE